MKLEHQVVSLELAKRLKELGVEQESLFWYSKLNGELKVKFFDEDDYLDISEMEVYSAFTVAELGEMLPVGYHTFAAGPRLEDRMYICYYTNANGDRFDYAQEADTEADARAKMLIYLLENKLV